LDQHCLTNSWGVRHVEDRCSRRLTYVGHIVRLHEDRGDKVAPRRQIDGAK
jgi:hypothetical protein